MLSDSYPPPPGKPSHDACESLDYGYSRCRHSPKSPPGVATARLATCDGLWPTLVDAAMRNLFTFVLVIGCSVAWGNRASAEPPVDYLRQIKPILASRCFACHGALKQESGLRLDA